ncbi:ATP-binding protein [Candidatus Aerophobetes bacterium]|uniref:ATP-binding protein n=1 Tax=Aerophobetes bacterium TaxID=2030807 RepID=A0A497E6T0_UNCAE|nr:MAG: ATP-binding protein [Candidatus Aerophobetes bacterium]
MGKKCPKENVNIQKGSKTNHRNAPLSIAIRAVDLTKYYGKLRAVDHISFEVKRGEIFGFLGPNGAGKSTTIRMLTGILKPDGGEIYLSGINLKDDLIEARRVMGIVPETCNVYVDLSVWENLMLMGKLYGVPKTKRKVRARELLERFSLHQRKDEKARKLSKGLKQRLILAMCLIHNPDILFLDEPTSGLDVQSSRLIRGIIKELKQKGVTVFLTTHNIEEANLMCDRIAIINKGKLAAIDTPQRLKGVIQGSQSVEVAFDRSKPDELRWLKDIPCVSRVEKLGNKFRLYTDDPDKVICEIVKYRELKSQRLTLLNTLGPSLEDVFLELIREEAE